MEQQLPKVKPLCPPGRPLRYEDVPFAEVTLDNGEPYTLKNLRILDKPLSI